ncbi:MAG: hypothetical protein ABIR29_01985 [Chthoniobacterales bacterium]
MQSYYLKLSARDEDPFTEDRVSQFFADGEVDRNTPCRPVTGGDWKTIDDYLPMLKYGTQLPNPTPATVVRSEDPPVYGAGLFPPPLPLGRTPTDLRVSVVDFDLPFLSILKLMFKWAGAGLIVSLCLVPVVMFLFFVVMAIFGTLLDGMLSGLQHP